MVVILDSCHSGLSGAEGLGTNDDAVASLLTGARAPMLVLAASKGRQFSRGSEVGRRSLHPCPGRGPAAELAQRRSQRQRRHRGERALPRAQIDGGKRDAGQPDPLARQAGPDRRLCPFLTLASSAHGSGCADRLDPSGPADSVPISGIGPFDWLHREAFDGTGVRDATHRVLHRIHHRKAIAGQSRAHAHGAQATRRQALPGPTGK